MRLHGFLSEKMSQKNQKNKTKNQKKQKDSDTWMDWYLKSRSCQFFIQKFHVLRYADSI